jgi:predicted transposase/invertase (TIGR01784 family)
MKDKATGKDTESEISEQADGGLPLPPLADPVISEIFKNAEVSGLAMRELINAVLEDSGDRAISEVIDVIPQKIDPEAQGRSYRVDVTAKTADNEITVFEVQLSPLLITNERSLLYAEQSLGSAAAKGDDWWKIGAKMPRVLVINILDFNLRKSGGFHQVAELVYREEPRELASERFGIHNIELKKFRKATPDLSKALHCWLTAICRSQDSRESLKEVIKMDGALSDFAAGNPGMKQFVDRYELASADKETRTAYRKWEYERALHIMEMQLQWAEGRAEGREEGREEGKAEGREEGKAEGREEGKAEGMIEAAKKLIKINRPINEIMEVTGLTREAIEQIRNAD